MADTKAELASLQIAILKEEHEVREQRMKEIHSIDLKIKRKQLRLLKVELQLKEFELENLKHK